LFNGVSKLEYKQAFELSCTLDLLFHSLIHSRYFYSQYSNCWGVEPPYLTWPTPLPLVKIRPWGVEFQPPHLSFAEVGMLLDSHFLLMQFLKYLGLHHDDLNVTTS